MKKKITALFMAITLAGTTGQVQAAQTQFDIGEAISVSDITEVEEMEVTEYVTASGGHPFLDVSNSAWYVSAVEYVYANNIMSGIGNNMFDPNGYTSRAMMVQILYNMEGRPVVTISNHFTDVSPDAWYASAVEWAMQKGITSGVSATKFAPNKDVTRQEVACFLYKYASFKGKDVSGRNSLSRFGDYEQVASWAVEAIQWANNAGIISGTDKGMLNPLGNATRAENASMMQRYMMSDSNSDSGNNNISQLVYAEQVVALVNEERAKENLAPLTMTESLKTVAEVRAEEISVLFAHQRPNGTSCFTVLREHGISFMCAGENIAYGYPSPESVVEGWMNSPGHRANIMDADFGHIGVGYYVKDSRAYWVQLFTD